MSLAIIHAGPAAPELKKLLKILDSVGAREGFFMSDLIATLQYEDKFSEDLTDMIGDLLNTNGYFDYCISHGDPELFQKYQSRFMDHVAVASDRVAHYLHTTLVTQGRYDVNGKFPYEYHSFDGRVISLRSL
ncbi:hypothetical protein [Ralstonia phage RP12]|uniref:Uncharacterized protein n=1 Tax=Ralstonia phage RP12 TaxID=1923889 RepID=A0A1L7N0J8_9CAUD|nr:hypothetical protein FDH28_gp009 [Ralstonia phage RP12]BAW18983.1 hypothetical protein [Ralstonia phage RP12]